MTSIIRKTARWNAARISAALGRFHEDENGLFSLVHLFTLLLCVLLFVLFFNVSHVVNEKVRLQNTADAVAISGGVWMARGMNVLTATNHVIGEMVGFLIVHEALGGAALDEDRSMEEATASEDAELDAAARAATAAGCPPDPESYKLVRQHGGVHAEATLLEAKLVLKKRLTWIYLQRAQAGAMQRSSEPSTVAAGIALEHQTDAWEAEVAAEYRILNRIHQLARSLLAEKKRICRKMAEAKLYTDEVVRRVPLLAQATAEKIADEHGHEGTLFPVGAELPVVIDPFAEALALVFDEDDYTEPLCDCGCPSKRTTINRDQIVKVTQLARAAFPWVNYHRDPILRRLRERLSLCKAADFYFDWTNGYSKRICDQLQRHTYHLQKHDDPKMGLYVIRDYPAPDKGYALWSEDPAHADRLFSVIGLARRTPPFVGGGGWGFSQRHEDGMIAYAQALVYNANEQQRAERRVDLTCKRIVPIRQSNTATIRSIGNREASRRTPTGRSTKIHRVPTAIPTKTGLSNCWGLESRRSFLKSR